jgi:flagellar motor switch protein FliN/FliY
MPDEPITPDADTPAGESPLGESPPGESKDDPILLTEEDLAAVFAAASAPEAAPAPADTPAAEPPAPAAESADIDQADIDAMFNDLSAAPPPAATATVAPPPKRGGGGGADAGIIEQAAIDALFGGAPAASAAPSRPKAPLPAAPPAASPAAAPTLSRGPRAAKSAAVGDLDLLADVVLTLSAEIGRTEMTINDVLKLRPGSLIELDKLAGELVELLIGERCIARGEVVVVDDSFGIRITEIGGV